MANRGPRVNVTVTEEQHALLLELAKLNGGSAAGLLRQMLDQATPLLRATVPALRMAAEEMNTTRAEAESQLQKMLSALRDVGVDAGQLDLLDGDTKPSPAASSEQGRRPPGGGRGAASQPPYSNTGVSTPPPSSTAKGASS